MHMYNKVNIQSGPNIDRTVTMVMQYSMCEIHSCIYYAYNIVL